MNAYGDGDYISVPGYFVTTLDRDEGRLLLHPSRRLKSVRVYREDATFVDIDILPKKGGENE